MAILSNQSDQFQLQLNRFKKLYNKYKTFHDENRKKTIDYQQENNYWMSFCDIQNNCFIMH